MEGEGKKEEEHRLVVLHHPLHHLHRSFFRALGLCKHEPCVLRQFLLQLGYVPSANHQEVAEHQQVEQSESNLRKLTM